MIPLWHYLAVSGFLFSIGLVGFLTRRNMITMFLCAELMLQGVILNLLAFSRFHGNLTGHVFALFIITVAACESCLALALYLVLYRRSRNLDAVNWQTIRENNVFETRDSEPLPASDTSEQEYPKLPTTGRQPAQLEETIRA